MELFRRVTVALSRAESDGELLDYARALAEMTPHAEYHFVHVLGWPKPGTGTVTHAEATEQIGSVVGRRFPGSQRAVTRVIAGTRVDALLEYVGQVRSDLILVGHRRCRTGRRSLARRLAMQAPCSVWMAPEGFPARIAAIAAGVDFSSDSADAVRVAAALAARSRLRGLAAVHIGEADGDVLSEFLRGLNLPDVPVRPVVERGTEVAAVLRAWASAQQIDLMVLGARGSNPSASVLLGCEAEQMLKESPLPVLVVAHPDGRRELLEALLDVRLPERQPE